MDFRWLGILAPQRFALSLEKYEVFASWVTLCVMWGTQVRHRGGTPMGLTTNTGRPTAMYYWRRRLPRQGNRI